MKKMKKQENRQNNFFKEDAPSVEASQIPSSIKLTNLSKKFSEIPDSQHEPLVRLTRPHRESFDWLVSEGVRLMLADLPKVEFALHNGTRVSLSFEELEVGRPSIESEKNLGKRKSFINSFASNVFPAECRQRGTTYKAPLLATFAWKVNEKLKGMVSPDLGEIPIMLKTTRCNLHGKTPKELVALGEEAHEMGGYFVINGIEKVIRMLVMTRRNYPLAMERKSWKSRGPLYTEKGILIRSVKEDQSSLTNTLHYLSNGVVTVGFTHRKEQFLVPVIMILKCLVNQTDQFIYRRMIQGQEDDSFLKASIIEMIRSSLSENVPMGDQQETMSYIGRLFRIRLPDCPPWWSNQQVGEYLITNCILPHLRQRHVEKFNLLVYMTRKLFRFVNGKCCAENPDSPMNQEVLLPGHLLGMLLKERLVTWLTAVKLNILKADQTDESIGETLVSSSGESVISTALRKMTPLTKAFEYLLATGNVVSQSGLGLMQASGFSVVAEKINFYRFLAHFRCIHRGAYFTEMRTTTVRKLLPEAWGFLCPVHTPDGTPCGLLNHLAASCEIVNQRVCTSGLLEVLRRSGLVPLEELDESSSASDSYTVLVDGEVVGCLPRSGAASTATLLRRMKAESDNSIPNFLEIGFVPATDVASQEPGMFLFTSPARMMRPVKNLSANSVEWIGSFEQVYLNVAVDSTEISPGQTTHLELSKTNMLSVIANLTPFSDFNQSPRNMYQCQMGKQTMATPAYSYPQRADNKLYRLMTPQTPFVRPRVYDYYQMDNYPMGTNAVVAVISYTGYDMEDAMIINKGSFERGFCWGYIYKSEIIDLRDVTGERRWVSKFPYVFGNPDPEKFPGLEADGFPPLGTELKHGDPMYSYVSVNEPQTPIVKRFNKSENAFVEQIKALQSEHSSDGFARACLTLRFVRHPIIGDKFASRHGQKGVCSLRYPHQDMPFCESGVVPDIIFNPHGYPSRMTIGMMLESMAGKSVAVSGVPEDASPFSDAFSESRPAHEYHGELLRRAGFDYYGTETMYSGIGGQMLTAEIFIGVVYYQRLRHMVSDKYQVRTTGPIDSITRQPVKGRKVGGGIRFGEMERDALVSHGASFLLQERLMNVSDRSIARICTECKQLFTTSMLPARKSWGEPRVVCRVCGSSSTVQSIVVPYCFQYLVAELAAVNIKTEISCKTAT